jgi:Lipocalin-like domain
MKRNMATIGVVVMLGVGSSPSSGMAQRAALRAQLVGSWTFVSSKAKLADGSPQWGVNPTGLLIFTDDGHFSWQVFRSDRPRFASNDRTKGTPAENKATLDGSLAYFGTYAVDERTRTLITHIDGSTFPNSQGEEQRRVITRLTAEELVYVNLQNTLGARVDAVWKRLK